MKKLNVALERAEMNANAILDYALSEEAGLPKSVRDDIVVWIDVLLEDFRGYAKSPDTVEAYSSGVPKKAVVFDSEELADAFFGRNQPTAFLGRNQPNVKENDNG